VKKREQNTQCLMSSRQGHQPCADPIGEDDSTGNREPQCEGKVQKESEGIAQSDGNLLSLTSHLFFSSLLSYDL